MSTVLRMENQYEPNQYQPNQYEANHYQKPERYHRKFSPSREVGLYQQTYSPSRRVSSPSRKVAHYKQNNSPSKGAILPGGGPGGAVRIFNGGLGGARRTIAARENVGRETGERNPNMVDGSQNSGENGQKVPHHNQKDPLLQQRYQHEMQSNMRTASPKRNGNTHKSVKQVEGMGTQYIVNSTS